MIRELVRCIIDKIKSYRLLKYYHRGSGNYNHQGQTIIYMADGRIHHGGLSDRICGMVSAYHYCKRNGISFKIHFTSPYTLQDILEPACYDWIITKEDISYNKKDARPIYLSTYSTDYNKMTRYFETALDSLGANQIHLYTNSRYFRWEEFQPLFAELFKPGPMLKRLIDLNKEKLPSRYVSLTFRFQQLLGDFKEDGFPIINSEAKRRKLIEQCMSVVYRLHDDVQMPIFVTSDSTTFLNEVSSLEYVYVIPGQLRHLDFDKSSEIDIKVDMKSFVDLYLLANADRLYLYAKKPLYNSSFPRTAARIYNKPFVQLD